MVYSGIERVNRVKMSIPFRFIHMFYANLIKIPTRFFCRHKQAYFKIYIER